MCYFMYWTSWMFSWSLLPHVPYLFANCPILSSSMFSALNILPGSLLSGITFSLFLPRLPSSSKSLVWTVLPERYPSSGFSWLAVLPGWLLPQGPLIWLFLLKGIPLLDGCSTLLSSSSGLFYWTVLPERYPSSWFSWLAVLPGCLFPQVLLFDCSTWKVSLLMVLLDACSTWLSPFSKSSCWTVLPERYPSSWFSWLAVLPGCLLPQVLL
jgi:hypothetical protein